MAVLVTCPECSAPKRVDIEPREHHANVSCPRCSRMFGVIKVPTEIAPRILEGVFLTGAKALRYVPALLFAA